MKDPIRGLPQRHAVKIWDLYLEYLRRYLWKTDFKYNSKPGFTRRSDQGMILHEPRSKLKSAEDGSFRVCAPKYGTLSPEL